MTALLEIRNLHAGYGASQVLHGVDLQVQAAQIVALGGRNGSGRSTLAKAIMGQANARGTIRYAGKDISRLSTFEIAREGIGYVAETRDIFPELTVDENLLLGARPARRGNVFSSAELFRWFPSLAQRRAVRGSALSGGEQQMLALARSLMGHPDLLIIDEPSEGLAPSIIAQLVRCLNDARAAGTAVLLIEQRFTIARAIASHVAVMGGGRIVFDGPITALDESIMAQWMGLGVDIK